MDHGDAVKSRELYIFVTMEYPTVAEIFFPKEKKTPHLIIMVMPVTRLLLPSSL
jgi:hypothetical protein